MNARDGECGDTSLHLAARRGDLNIVKLLISLSADWHQRNNCGLTALDEARLTNHWQVSEQLITYAQLSDDDDVKSALIVGSHLALRGKLTEAVHFWISALKSRNAYSRITATTLPSEDLAAYRQSAYDYASLPSTSADVGQLFYDDGTICISTVDDTKVKIRKEKAHILALLYAECVLGLGHKEVTRGLRCLASHCYNRQSHRRLAVLSYCVLRELKGETKLLDLVSLCTTINLFCDTFIQFWQQAQLLNDNRQTTIEQCANVRQVLLFIRKTLAEILNNNIQAGN